MTYQEAEQIAKQYNIEHSVALDILYLDTLRDRMIKIAQTNPDIRDFMVYNGPLEGQLDLLESRFR